MAYGMEVDIMANDYTTKGDPDLGAAISDTSSSYDDAVGIMNKLPSLINNVYDNLISAGRERDAYALSDAAEKFASTGKGMGVNAFSRAQSLMDLQNKLGAAANLREAQLSESQLNQIKGIQESVAKLGVDKASTLFSQKQSKISTDMAQRSATRQSMALNNSASTQAYNAQMAAIDKMHQPVPDRINNPGIQGNPSSQFANKSPYDQNSAIGAMTNRLVQTTHGPYDSNLNPAQAGVLAKDIVLNKGLGGNMMAGANPQMAGPSQFAQPRIQGQPTKPQSQDPDPDPDPDPFVDPESLQTLPDESQMWPTTKSQQSDNSSATPSGWFTTGIKGSTPTLDKAYNLGQGTVNLPTAPNYLLASNAAPNVANPTNIPQRPAWYEPFSAMDEWDKKYRSSIPANNQPSKSAYGYGLGGY